MSDIKYAYYESSVGYKVTGKTNNDILAAGGASKPLSEFYHSGNFTPGDYVPGTRNITINGVTQNLTTDRSFTTPDTITRLKGGGAGTFTSGDISFVAGTNILVSQAGQNITIASTPYTAGDGLTLAGSAFSLPVTINGSGNVITAVTQNTNGITVQKGSVPTTGDLANYVLNSAVGANNGVASLGADGKIPSTQLPAYVDDVLEFANLAAFPATGETGKIYVAIDTNRTYRWSGTSYIQITSGAVDSVNGMTGVVTLNKSHVGLGNVDNTADAVKNVLAATKWTTARTITLSGVTATTQTIDGTGNVVIPITAIPTSLLVGTLSNNTTGSAASLTTARSIAMTGDGTWSVNFNGSANVTASLTLANTGVVAGTYTGVTVDAKGRVTAGTNVVDKKTETITNSAAITHNFGTRELDIEMMDSVTFYKVHGRIKMTTVNVLDIQFDSTPPNPIIVTVKKQ